MATSRRALIVAGDAARHPYLRSLPPHVRKARVAARGEGRCRITAADVREFLLAYCACFLAVSTFLL